MRIEKNPRILVRVDASSEIGLGHIMRCLTLQSALKNAEIDCYFVSREMPDTFCRTIVERGADFIRLSTPKTQSEAAELASVVNEIDASAVVVDHYGYDTECLLRTARIGPPLIVLDDINDRGLLHAAMVINSMPAAETIGYNDTAPEAELLIGIQYALLRSEFCVPKDVLKPASVRPRLTVTFGGSDILGLSVPVLRQLLDQGGALPLTLITGSGFAVTKDVTDLLERYPSIEHVHACSEMSRELQRSGLAVSAAGSIVYELAACGVPSILLTIADNQRLSAAAHAALGWSFSYDGRDPRLVASAVAHAVNLWRAPQDRDNLQMKALQLVDGMGGQRVAHRISQMVKQCRRI